MTLLLVNTPLYRVGDRVHPASTLAMCEWSGRRGVITATRDNDPDNLMFGNGDDLAVSWNEHDSRTYHYEDVTPA